MSWSIVTEHWRLKLLSVALAVLMLGAVGFSVNPPTTGTLTVSLNYSVGPNLILINPPSKVPVTYSGLANVIKNVNTNNLTAFVDATKAKPGPAVTLNVTAKDTISQVNVQDPSPITVQVDALQGKDIPVQVIARASPGWAITKSVAVCPGAQQPNPCVVHFTGPASWETNLTATVLFAPAINVGTLDSPTQPVQLQNSNGPVDSTIRTVPSISLDYPTVSVHIEALPGSTSSSVPFVDSPPTHPPAAGYRITAITITPNTVVISGNPTVLSKIQYIQLSAVDLSGRTSDANFQVQVQYPSGISGTVQTVKLVYSISPNPNATPGG